MPSPEKQGNPVVVCVRVRPLSAEECAQGGEALEVLSDTVLKTMTLTEGGRKVESQTHEYDCVLPQSSSQEDVFRVLDLSRLCHNALGGQNITILAYGQTGCGKTHTMLGPANSLTGLVPMSSSCIFSEVEHGVEKVQASFLEIYNEQVYDLLSDSPSVLPVRFSQNTGTFYAESALVVDCDNLDDLNAVLVEGISNRANSSHLLNADSSRSHSILTLYFRSGGKMTFVDLAGSERLKSSQSKGTTMTESCYINKSLLALGQVISSLYEQQQGSPLEYIPYRDSKLTKLLMDSLGGTACTVMVACVSPATCFIEETISTLKYASRARCITNFQPTRADMAQVSEIAELKNLIRELREENSVLKGSHTHPAVARGVPALTKESQQQLQDAIAFLQLENDRIRAENASLKKQQYLSVKQDKVLPGVLQLAKPTKLMLNDPLASGRLSSSPSIDGVGASIPDSGNFSRDALVAHLKSTLTRVTMDYKSLLHEKQQETPSAAQLIIENIKLAEVLSHYDILQHTLSGADCALTGSLKKDVESSALALQLAEARKQITDLSKEVQTLKDELEQVTTAPEPGLPQYIVDRRELRFQKSINTLLRHQLATSRR